MELSTAMRYVMMRAETEAAAAGHKEIAPEHILLGILKISERTAEKISPASRHKRETDKDIALLREIFRGVEADTKTARETLRRILRYEPPRDGAARSERVFETAKARAEGDWLYPSAVLHVILTISRTPQVRAALNMKETHSGKEHTEDGAAGARREGLPFLSALTQRIRDMRYALLKRVRGQDHAVHSFAEGMFSAEVLAAADEERRRPRAIFVFAGPPGVGKTFLAEQAAEALAIPFKRFDMSGFSDHHTDSVLIGFARSWKNAVEGQLTGYVKKNPHCILLFDEIEKAHLNIIHLFLQILDAGRLHDNYHDEDIAFKDTIIIFTSNAGSQLYEDGRNAAGLPRRTILNALETDVHPQTGKPFFPAAICSRLATGYPLMFNHLAAHDLESVGKDELTRSRGLFEKQYGITASFDDLLPTILLFAEGGQADARTIRAQSESFFKNEIFKLCRLWGDRIDDAFKKLKKLHFAAEMENLPENVSALFKSSEKPELLIFGDAALAARLEQAEPDIVVHGASDQETAFALLARHDIGFTLLKLVGETAADFDPTGARMSFDEPMRGSDTIHAFDNIPMAASPLNNSRSFFKELRERMPEMPVYLLETGGFFIDEELENAFARAGARGKLTVSASGTDVFAEEVQRVAEQLYLRTSAALLAAERKILSFETAPILSSDETTATIRLRAFALRRAADAGDVSAVLEEVEKPQVRFTDVIGAQGAKEELEFFIQYLRNPKSFAAKGLKPPKGVLLYGPPGTGKTLLAKAMAGESDAAFIPFAASAFVTKWVGSGPQAVRELFSRARRYAPSIAFIDEIDAIGRVRQGRGGSSGHAEEMALTALLTEMDGFTADPKRPVFVLAATNFDVEEGKGGLGLIDPALARRFDRRILVDLPAKDDRRRFLEYALGKRTGHTVGTAMMERLAGRSAGLSLANLESVIELAARNAAKRDEPLGDEILEEAFEVSRHGEQKDWGREYLERVARHEAGHAWLCYLGGNAPSYLTIIARGSHGGYMEHADVENAPLQTKEALLSRIRTSLGGRAAELVYYGNEEGLSTGASGDLESATKIAGAMLTRYGMDADFGIAAISREEAEKGSLVAEIRSKINGILEEQMDKTISLIRDGREKIDKLTEALLEKNKLTREEIEELLSG